MRERLVYEPDMDYQLIKDTEEVGELLLAILTIALEQPKNQQWLERIIGESKECEITGKDEELC